MMLKLVFGKGAMSATREARVNEQLELVFPNDGMEGPIWQ